MSASQRQFCLFVLVASGLGLSITFPWQSLMHYIKKRNGSFPAKEIFVPNIVFFWPWLCELCERVKPFFCMHTSLQDNKPVKAYLFIYLFLNIWHNAKVINQSVQWTEHTNCDESLKQSRQNSIYRNIQGWTACGRHSFCGHWTNAVTDIFFFSSARHRYKNCRDLKVLRHKWALPKLFSLLTGFACTCLKYLYSTITEV